MNGNNLELPITQTIFILETLSHLHALNTVTYSEQNLQLLIAPPSMDDKMEDHLTVADLKAALAESLRLNEGK